MTPGRPHRRAFTLLEVCVALALLGLLVGLSLPAVQRVRASAARASCQDRLRQVGIGLHGYEAAHGHLPPDHARPPGGPLPPMYYAPWTTFLYPHLDQQPLWAATEAAFRQFPREVDRVPPHVGFRTPVTVFACPADARLILPLESPFGFTAAYAGYVGVVGHDGAEGMMMHWQPGTRLTHVRDGNSQTVMVGERPPPAGLQAGLLYTAHQQVLAAPETTDAGPDNVMMVVEGLTQATRCRPTLGPGNVAAFYYGPGRLDNPCDKFHFWSLHPGGANWLFGDGAVRFLPYTARDLLPALATRAGGEAATLPD
jgi:prepilin-type N-terminal cleavage/methylation domain-containing protein/prepilin-type processing-associated H-X9-DG protein